MGGLSPMSPESIMRSRIILDGAPALNERSIPAASVLKFRDSLIQVVVFIHLSYGISLATSNQSFG